MSSRSPSVRGLFSRSPRVVFSESEGCLFGVRGLSSRSPRVVFSESEDCLLGVRQSEGCFLGVRQSRVRCFLGVRGLFSRSPRVVFSESVSPRVVFSESEGCFLGVRGLFSRSPRVVFSESEVFLPGVRSVGGRTANSESDENASRSPRVVFSESEVFLPGVRSVGGRTANSESDEKRSECELGVRQKFLGLRAASVAAVASVAPAPLPRNILLSVHQAVHLAELCDGRIRRHLHRLTFHSDYGISTAGQDALFGGHAMAVNRKTTASDRAVHVRSVL